MLSFCQVAVTRGTLAVGAIGMPRPGRETGIIVESFLVRMLGQAADAQAGSIGMIKNHEVFLHVMFRSGALSSTKIRVHGAGGLFGLARQGLGLSAGDRAA